MVLLASQEAWDSGTQPPMLMIVREQINPASRVAYDRTETGIRRICERWGCPNPYLALTRTSAPDDVWRLTAWSSQEQLDEVGALYADNPALMARLAPLSARKRALTDEPIKILARAVGEAPFVLAGARFLTVTPVAPRRQEDGALYDWPDGRRVLITPSHERPLRPGRGAVALAVQPNWSLPPAALAAADPVFWAARQP